MSISQYSQSNTESRGIYITKIELLVIIFAFSLPSYANTFIVEQIGVQVLALGMIALSLMFLSGMGGMVTLSQMSVAGIAAYCVAIFGSSNIGPSLGLPLWLAIILAILIAVIYAVIIGFLSLRTNGVQTIMITLAISMAFFFFANQNYVIFNGFSGFQGVYPPSFGGFDWEASNGLYYLSLILAILAYGFICHLRKTTFGLALQGIRDSTRRMHTLGFNVAIHKITAHAIAGLLAAIGGILLLWLNKRVSPGFMGIGPLIDILIIAIIGGIGRPSGAFAGSVVYVLLKVFAIDIINPERFNTLIGIVFLLVVFVSPKGLIGIFDYLYTRFLQLFNLAEPPNIEPTNETASPSNPKPSK